MRAALAEGAPLLVADERVADSVVAPGDDIERLNYGWSVLHCLPATRATSPVVANGTVLRSATVRQWASEAGFSQVEELPIAHDFWRFYLGGLAISAAGAAYAGAPPVTVDGLVLPEITEKVSPTTLAPSEPWLPGAPGAPKPTGIECNADRTVRAGNSSTSWSSTWVELITSDIGIPSIIQVVTARHT